MLVSRIAIYTLVAAAIWRWQILIDGTDRRTDRRTDISPTHRRLPLETASVKNTIKKQLVIFVLRSSFGCFETCLSSKLC